MSKIWRQIVAVDFGRLLDYHFLYARPGLDVPNFNNMIGTANSVGQQFMNFHSPMMNIVSSNLEVVSYRKWCRTSDLTLIRGY